MSKPRKAKTKAASKSNQATIAEMMSKAADARAKNKDLIQAVRQNVALAKEVRELLCADLRRVYEIPRDLLGPSASRRRYREHGHYSEELVTYLIGQWEEFKRKAGIEPTLAVRTVERNISKTLRSQDVAEYADQYIKPWDGAYSRLNMSKEMVTLVIGSDFHSAYCDPFALRVFMETIEQLQPDGVRFNGDLVDFPSLSRHRQMPGHFALNLQEEIDCGVAIMEEARNCAPDADLKLVLGNHDIRLATALADAAPIFSTLRSLSFASLFQLDQLEVGLIARSTFLNPSSRNRKADIAENWETLPDAHGNPMWTTVHGFLTGADAPKKHLAKFMTNGTNGHLHNPMMVTGGSYATGMLQWHQTGSMAYSPAVGAGYIQGPVEAGGWATSFLVVRLFPRHGHVQAQQVFVSEVANVDGVKYTISQAERRARQAMLEIL